MKSKGLSSTARKQQKHTTNSNLAAANHVGHLASKERQKSLRMQAERAQIERQKREQISATAKPTLKAEES